MIDVLLAFIAAIFLPLGMIWWFVMLRRGEANAGHWFPWVEPKTPNRFPWEAVFGGIGALAAIIGILRTLP